MSENPHAPPAERTEPIEPIEPIERITDLPPAPSRPPEGHKGSFGKALLVAGSVGMAGAAGLAGQGALHGGAGLVSLAVPERILATVASYHPAYTTIPLVSDSPVAQLLTLAQDKQAVGLGPGLGTGPTQTSIVQGLFERCPSPLVLDADGLNALQLTNKTITHHIAPRILTPHPGEFARLTGLGIPEIHSRREELALEYARRWNTVILLKGPNTVIADPSRLAINGTGNSALATGGSGDILTGLIVAMLAQGMEPFEATQFAAHLHGLAGEIAGETYSPYYVTAVEILHSLAQAWKRVS